MARNRKPLGDRVVSAAERMLAAQKYVSPIDVLPGIGWLDPNSLKRWRQGQVPSLEEVLQSNLPRISEAMQLFRSWAEDKGLQPNETAYVARTPGRPVLQFSRSGDAMIERLYRTHWVSPELSERKRERLAEKARAPELVAIRPRNVDWTCHRCGGSGVWLIMENAGPSCLGCVGLGDLEFLPASDPLLTRRAKARARATPWWCASAGPANATSARAFWSSRRPGGRLSARSRPSANSLAPQRGICEPRLA